MKKKATHPGKVGKVGPKKKDLADIKTAVTIYKTPREINELGGLEILREKIQAFVKTLKPL